MNDPRAAHIAAIDLRHRNWIESVLLSGRFERVLEIGSYDGYSTEAFWSALEKGAVKEVHLCDIRLRPELADQLEIYGSRYLGHVYFHQCPSTQLLAVDGEWDLIVVDGDHSEANCLNELPLLLNTNAKVVFLHDTGSYGRYVGCEGPAHLKRAYQRAGWWCVEDNLHRIGERTERALFAATRSTELYPVLLDGYRQWC